MKPCKRIEIVIEEALTRRLATLLENLNAPGYTVIPRASGRGDRGVRRGDDPTGTMSNAVFVIAADDATGDADEDGLCDDSDECYGLNDSGDADQDGLKDELEGCGPPPVDTDGDKIPDYGCPVAASLSDIRMSAAPAPRRSCDLSWPQEALAWVAGSSEGG